MVINLFCDYYCCTLQKETNVASRFNASICGYSSTLPSNIIAFDY